MRGIETEPQPCPAQGCETRIQQELFSFLLAFAIPVELHLHPAVLIRVNLFAPRPDDHGRLAALHERLRRYARAADRERRAECTRSCCGNVGSSAGLRPAS